MAPTVLGATQDRTRYVVAKHTSEQDELTVGAAFPLLAGDQRFRGNADLPLSIVRQEIVKQRQADKGNGAESLSDFLVDALFDREPQPSFAVACPGLLLVAEEDLVREALGTRAWRSLYRARFRRWRDLLSVVPMDLLKVSLFGRTCLKQLLEVALVTSIEALCEATPESIDSWRHPPDFDRGRVQSNLAEKGLIKPTFGDQFPELLVYGEARVSSDMLPARLRKRLPSVRTWNDLLALRPSDIAVIPNVGEKSLSDLRTNLRAETKKTVRLKTAISGDAAEEPADELNGTFKMLLSNFNSREQTVMERRLLSTSKPTLELVGKAIGLTRERVRQIERTASDRLTHLLARDEYSPIHARGTELRERLGSAAPEDSELAAHAKCWATNDIDTDLQNEFWRLLLYIAGPYRSENGWLSLVNRATDPRRADLKAIFGKSIPLASDEVETALLDLGIRPEVHDAWLKVANPFRETKLGWVPKGSSVLEQAIQYLQVLGMPATPEVILEAIGRTDASARALRHRLFHDPRSMRVSKNEVGLREWGLNEYTSLPEEMAQEIETLGGAAQLDALVERLVERFDVSPTSVRMYAQRPMFVIESDGRVRLRRKDEPFQFSRDVAEVPGCYELGDTKVAWRVKVDHEILRGSGRRLPQQLAGWLGLEPGKERTFSAIAHDLVTVWRPWSWSADMSALRKIADMYECKSGDYLVITFDRARGSASFRAVTSEAPRDPLGRLLVMMGLSQRANRKQAALEIATVLGLPTEDPMSLPFRIRGVLSNHKDDELVSLAEEALFG